MHRSLNVSAGRSLCHSSLVNHDGLRFFNPYADIRETKNCLPHWQQESAVYFVTFRLGDAVPRNLCDEWQNDREAWLLGHPKPWDASTEREYHERFSGAIERWLDRGYGSCVLRQRDCAEIVAGTLRHFDGERLVLLSSIVMPNHVHALFVQHAAWPWRSCCTAGRPSRRVRSTRCSDDRAASGSEITSIDWCGMKNTSGIAFVIFGAIQSKQD